MKNLFFILLLFSTATSTAQKSLDLLLQVNNSESVPYISVEELRMLQLQSDVLILDAREKVEFDVSHISSAKFVGFKKFSTEAISEEIQNKEIPIIVYCSVGIRSEDIGEKLINTGFKNVKNLYGGIFEWKNKNYPVVDSEENETDNVHTYSKFWSRWLTNGIKVYN